MSYLNFIRNFKLYFVYYDGKLWKQCLEYELASIIELSVFGKIAFASHFEAKIFARTKELIK